MWQENNIATIRRKKQSHPESDLQKACVKWFKMQYRNKIIIAIPNGGKRSRIEAAIMKGEGVMSGVCDLFIPEPTKAYHGLWIELKTGKNTTTESQDNFMMEMSRRFYRVELCYTFDFFKKIIDKYFGDY